VVVANVKKREKRRPALKSRVGPKVQCSKPRETGVPVGEKEPSAAPHSSSNHHNMNEENRREEKGTHKKERGREDQNT